MRGCFNSRIASLILKKKEMKSGCYPIPPEIGSGTLCVCDSNLCNSNNFEITPTSTATSLKVDTIPSKFSLSSTVRYFPSSKLYFGLLVMTVMFERIALL